jgi:hypothetical protein
MGPYITHQNRDNIHDMIRTQISFEEEQYEALQAAARRDGVSMAALVRDAVEDKLRAQDADRERIKRRALSVIGKYRGSGEPVSQDHDRYLEEAYTDW